MKVNLSPHFKRSYKKLPKHIQNDFDSAIRIFIKNPSDPVLKTHKLEGSLQEYLAFKLKKWFQSSFRIF